MARSTRNSSRKFGLPPGSLVFTGRKKTEQLHVGIMDYGPDRLEESQSHEIASCFPSRDTMETSWVTITGLHDTEKIEALTSHFGIHPLVSEDILNISQRPKVEIFDDYIFITLKILDFEKETRHIGIDQVSLILGNGYVLMFQEQQEPLFEPLRKRIRESKGRIRKMNSDYLLYAILDIIVDHYFVNLEQISDHIETIEQQLITDPEPETLNEIYRLKREVLFLRKSVWPLRESVGRLEKSESPLITEKIIPYLRDLYDHTIQAIDSVETSRDLLSGMLDLYLSSVSNRMNQVMKMLTIIATIFIPLTFVVGIYGMNFENMPELQWHYAYYAVLGFMFAVAIGMLIWFRRKQWL
jgi:magnesium transporter